MRKRASLLSFVTYVSGLATIIIVLLFRDEPVVVTSIVAALSILLVCLEWSIGRIIVFCFLFASALATEIAMVHLDVWTYPLSTFFEIPLWIPFVWVNGGFVFIQFKEDIDSYLRKS